MGVLSGGNTQDSFGFNNPNTGPVFQQQGAPGNYFAGPQSSGAGTQYSNALQGPPQYDAANYPGTMGSFFNPGLDYTQTPSWGSAPALAGAPQLPSGFFGTSGPTSWTNPIGGQPLGGVPASAPASGPSPVPNPSSNGTNAPNTPYNQLNPALAGFSATSGAASPAGYYQQPLSDVISGTGYNTAPTFATTLASRLTGVKAESPGALQGDINASTQSGGGPNGQQPTGWASWTPAAQWAWDYGTTHPDAPEVQQAGSLQAFADQYNDQSKYGWSALSGYTPAQMAAAPQGTTYGNGQAFSGQVPQAAPLSGSQIPQSAPTQTQASTQTTQNPASIPATGNPQDLVNFLTQLFQGPQSSTSTTPLGYTQYNTPSNAQTSSNAISPQILALLATILGGQNQNVQQKPFWYL